MIPVYNDVSNVRTEILRLRNGMANLHFIGNARQWVLVDGGLPGSAGAIREVARAHFGADVAPRAIVLTHGHFDHIGAFPQLFDVWDVPVFAHADELPFLTGQSDYPPPDPSVGKGLVALSSFLYPYRARDFGARVQPLPGDGTVPDAPDWRWIATPGHSPGHVSLLRTDDVLVAGDAFVTTKQESLGNVLFQRAGVHGPPAYFTPDWTTAKRSVEMLAGIRIGVATTGHGPVMSGSALERGLHHLVETFDDAVIPHRGRYVPTS